MVERGGGGLARRLVAEHIVAAAAGELVGAEAAEQQVRPAAADEHVVRLAAEHAERAVARGGAVKMQSLARGEAAAVEGHRRARRHRIVGGGYVVMERRAQG